MGCTPPPCAPSGGSARSSARAPTPTPATRPIACRRLSGSMIVYPRPLLRGEISVDDTVNPFDRLGIDARSGRHGKDWRSMLAEIDARRSVGCADALPLEGER